MIEDYIDISSEVIYRDLRDDDIFRQIQHIFFKKLYNAIFNKSTSSIILKYNEFQTIFTLPKHLSINNRSITLKKKVIDLFLKDTNLFFETIKDKKKIKSNRKLNDLLKFLDQQIFSIYLNYFNNKLGVFSLKGTLKEISKNVNKKTYRKFKKLSLEFISKITI